ncbi:MAG: 3-oxoacyl-[acyl-carrier-protein] reductase [Planctomycetota bacterium]
MTTDQRIAFVTGASRGIGKAIALRLAQEGRHVVLASRSEGPLSEVKSQIEQTGGSASVCVVDISDRDALADAVTIAAKDHGRFDILVNNAGITRDNLLMRMSLDEWDAVISTNLTSAFVAMKAAARPMMKGKFGRIVNIASTSGLVGNAGQANYAAAKSGLVGMTRSVARELGGKGVTANVVAPGFINTDMTGDLPEDVMDSIKSMVQVGRLGEPEDIASAVAFATADDAGFMTGQVITVDGGMTMC